MVAKQKILIVDDDNNIAELISLYLTKECFDTCIVNDGEQALQEFEEQYPSQVLALEMDLNEAESMKQAVAKTREHFETNFYGKGLLGTEHKIPDYDVLGEKYRKELLVNHHDQAGDPERGGEVIVETVLGQKQPFRLLLGKDAAMAAESEMEKRLEEIREWKEVSCQSDYR